MTFHFTLSRRRFLQTSSLAAGASLTLPTLAYAAEDTKSLPPAIAALNTMRAEATPITAEERSRRQEKARQLMRENSLSAVLLPQGTSLTYFTGIRWGNSERLTAVVIPKVGNPYIVTPAFEEDRTREQLAGGPVEHTDVAIWQEDESPFERLATGLKERGIATGRVGIEETSKFVFADSISGAAPALKVVSATPIVHPIAVLEIRSSSGSWTFADHDNALKPSAIDSPSAMTPRRSGTFDQRWAHDGASCTSVWMSPSGVRTDTAHVRSPRIMTPSTTACPPM